MGWQCDHQPRLRTPSTGTKAKCELRLFLPLHAHQSSLLFVLCFLFSAKGDGIEFRDYLREVGSAFAEQPFGRCELSKRQDWCLEAAFVLSGVVSEVLAYTCKTRQLGANTLRDSIFQRLELIHFDAYIHVCATMWVVAFEELRALTNSTEVALNPIELHRIYDKLWELGTKLQSESSLDIYSGDYRPWEEQRGLESFYKKKWESGGLREARWKLLCAFGNWDDKEKYIPVLKKIFHLFGEGIHESLKRTMGEYLEATGGSMAESKLEPWVKARAVQLIAHNNHAERPFAVTKLFDHWFPSMSFGNKAGLSHARCNGTFKPATAKAKKKIAPTAPKVGAAIAADPCLQRAVSEVCSVRRRKIDGRMVPAGVVSRLVREHRAADGADSAEMRKKKTAKKFEENKQMIIRKAQKKDAASEVVLVESEGRLDELLEGKSGKGAALDFLSKQYNARIVGKCYIYSMEAIPAQYRGKNKDSKTGIKKLRKSPDSGDAVAYLTSLVKLMIKEDTRLARYDATGAAAATDDTSYKTLARQLPVISEEYTSSMSKKLKGKERDEAASLWDIEDDAYLTELTEKYTDQIFYDEEVDATYKVLDVQYDERGEAFSKTEEGH